MINNKEGKALTSCAVVVEVDHFIFLLLDEEVGTVETVLGVEDALGVLGVEHDRLALEAERVEAGEAGLEALLDGVSGDDFASESHKNLLRSHVENERRRADSVGADTALLEEVDAGAGVHSRRIDGREVRAGGRAREVEADARLNNNNK